MSKVVFLDLLSIRVYRKDYKKQANIQ